MKYQLNEETFRLETLDQNKQEKIFDIFKSSYEASIGTSWTKDKFYGRAKNWLFFGDDNGFVTVRPQQSGLYKLTGVAGNLKSILKGLEELQQLNVPVWGMVSKDIQTMANKKNLKTPPGFLVKIMLGFIPKSTFGGVDFEINSDGSVTMKYEDVGDAKKYFVGNDLYFKQIKKDLYPKIKEKISDLPLLARKSIELFLNESKQEIDMNEEITSGSVIVYHRTGSKGGSPVEGISADGYRVGNGAHYGVGVYTTYNLESQTKYPNMINTYGNIIIESKVLSLDKFLIFDYDIAKRVYGNKNYKLDKQLQIILGKEYNKYKDNEELLELINRLEDIDNSYTSNISYNFYHLFKNTIIKKVRGLVFTGGNDGNVLLCYERKNVEPLRYTIDEGKTWTNITNKTVYGRAKGYNPEESNIEIEHIKNKLDTGDRLNNNEINIILNNKEYNNILNNDNIDNIIYFSKEQDKIINIILNNKNLVNKLNNDNINKLLYYSSESEQDKIINIILNNKNLVNKLNNDNINKLLYHSSEPDKIISILGDKSKEYLTNINDDEIKNLIIYSKEPYKILNIVGNKGIEHLLSNSDEPDNEIDNILNNEILLNKLTDKGIEYLLKYSEEPDKVINHLITYSNDTNRVSNILKKIRPDLFKESSNPNKVKEIISNRKQLQENIKRIKILMI